MQGLYRMKTYHLRPDSTGTVGFQPIPEFFATQSNPSLSF